MPLSDLADQQSLFLRSFGAPEGMSVTRARAFQDALASAVLHNALYAPATKANERHEVIAEWKKVLADIASGYSKRHGAEHYEHDLLRLEAHMNCHFGMYFRQTRHPTGLPCLPPRPRHQTAGQPEIQGTRRQPARRLCLRP